MWVGETVFGRLSITVSNRIACTDNYGCNTATIQAMVVLYLGTRTRVHGSLAYKHSYRNQCVG